MSDTPQVASELVTQLRAANQWCCIFEHDGHSRHGQSDAPFKAADLIERLSSPQVASDSERVEAVALTFSEQASEYLSSLFDDDFPEREWEALTVRLYEIAEQALSSIPAQHDGPTIESLRAKVERASERGPVGPDLGAMSHSERNEHLFGLVKRLRYWESDGHPHGLLHRESADRITELEAQLASAQQEVAEAMLLDDIAAMMGEFVDNWPKPKRVKTALALIAKTMQAALDPPRHKYWGAGEPDCPREIKAGNGELHTLRCKVCGTDNPRDDRCFAAMRSAALQGDTK